MKKAITSIRTVGLAWEDMLLLPVITVHDRYTEPYAICAVCIAHTTECYSLVIQKKAKESHVSQLFKLTEEYTS